MTHVVSARQVARVRMLGPLEITIDGVRLGPRDFDGVKPKQILEVLLLERGRTVSKDRIADLLWAEELPKRVASTVEMYVSMLRNRLGRWRWLIVTERGGYRLETALADVDADRFDALIRRAAGAPSADRRVALEDATALGDGDLLADEPYAGWVLLDREHYRARQTQALIDLAECCLDAGDFRAALTTSDRVFALTLTSERAYRVAMRAHAALGDRDAALRAYVRCRAALSDELGVDPTAATVGLHDAILGERALMTLSPHADRSAGASEREATLPVAYAGDDGIRIAYSVVGDGPIDLVFIPSFVTNLGATWDDPTYAAFLRRLASMARLILFDKRGTGLSDPALDFPTTRERSDDLLTVLDAAGSRRAVLYGVCGGGALAAHFAADHPDRTAGLILHNSFARLLRTDDYPWGWTSAAHERFLAAFEGAWMGNGSGLSRRNPGLASNPRYRDWFARYVRLAANPWMCRRLADMNAEIDIRPLLGAIHAPCLVTCTTEDAWLSPDNSRYLAAHIAGARLLELPGVDHDPWVGDSDQILDAVGDFIDALATRSVVRSRRTRSRSRAGPGSTPAGVIGDRTGVGI